MSNREYHFWIVAKDEGKPYLVYGGRTESEARQKGMDMLGGINFDIKRFPTRDLAAASAYYRGKRLENGEGLRKSTQRIGHDKSIKRMKHNRQPSNW